MGHMRQIAQKKMVNLNAKISKIILKELKVLSSSAKRQKSLYWKKPLLPIIYNLQDT